MHGTVLIDDDGRLVLDRVPLWNDKRTREIVEEFQRTHDTNSHFADCGESTDGGVCRLQVDVDQAS